MKPHNKEIYYVGIGSSTKRAYNKTGRNIHWKRVYKKYGVLVDIVCENISLEEAKEIEKFMISCYGLNNLTNITLGGEGAFGLKHSDERREMLSKRNKGNTYRKGIKHSEETIQKLKICRPNFKHTEESKEKISKSLYGREVSQTSRDKTSRTHKENGHGFSREAIEKAIKIKKEKALRVREVTTNVEGYAWEFQEKFGICERVIRYNCLHDKPISKGKSKGLNFIKL